MNALAVIVEHPNMEVPKEILDVFNWHDISIQKNEQGEAFLILAAY